LTHSVSAGLDYPAIGPEHCLAAHQGARNMCRQRSGALDACLRLARMEDIIPELESSGARDCRLHQARAEDGQVGHRDRERVRRGDKDYWDFRRENVAF